MKSLVQLKRNLKQDFSHLKSIKVALLGDTATQLLKQAIRVRFGSQEITKWANVGDMVDSVYAKLNS